MRRRRRRRRRRRLGEEDHNNHAAREPQAEKPIKAFQTMCEDMFREMVRKIDGMEPWQGDCSNISRAWVEQAWRNADALWK